jgi:hypothetical protein
MIPIVEYTSMIDGVNVIAVGMDNNGYIIGICY